MKFGVLGTGDVARALAQGLVATGRTVRIGTRDPTSVKVAELVRTLGPKASAGTFAEAAKFGEVNVLAVRGAAAIEILGMAGAAHFAKKVLIDPTNPLEFHPNAPPTLFVAGSDSLGERVQRAVPEAHVVKAFNTIGNAHFYKPQFPGGPPDMFYCGNDAASKESVGGLIGEFGLNPIDIGGIDGSRELEAMCILWVKTAFRLGSFDVGFKVLRK